MPWSFDEAVEQHRAAKAAQDAKGDEIARAYAAWGRAQRLYSVALARRMFELKQAGTAVTACEVLAKGDPEIAVLREERDVAEGLKESAKSAAWAANKDRAELEALLRWSMSRELAEGYGTPASAIGRRAA